MSARGMSEAGGLREAVEALADAMENGRWPTRPRGGVVDDLRALLAAHPAPKADPTAGEQQTAEKDAGIYQGEAACFSPVDANGDAYEWGDGTPHWATASEGHRMMREIRLDRPDAQIKLARESEPCWHLVCAGCGYRYDEDEWISHFPSRSDALDAADGSDWTVVDGAAYCWECPIPPAVPAAHPAEADPTAGKRECRCPCHETTLNGILAAHTGPCSCTLLSPEAVDLLNEVRDGDTTRLHAMFDADPLPATPDAGDASEHDFLPVAGHPDDDECTHRSDGTDATYCGRTRAEHDHHPRCYQNTGVPDDLPADLCDCRVLRMLDAARDASTSASDPPADFLTRMALVMDDAECERMVAERDAAREAKARAEGHRDGYESARSDMVSGAFIGGPTYEALRDSATGQRIATEARAEAGEQITQAIEAELPPPAMRCCDGLSIAARIAREVTS